MSVVARWLCVVCVAPLLAACFAPSEKSLTKSTSEQLFRLGLARARSENYEECVKYLQLALEKKRTARIYNNLAYCFRYMGKIQESKDMLELSLGLQTKRPEVYLNYVLTIRELGDKQMLDSIVSRLKQLKHDEAPLFYQRVTEIVADTEKAEAYKQYALSSGLPPMRPPEGRNIWSLEPDWHDIFRVTNTVTYQIIFLFWIKIDPPS